VAIMAVDRAVLSSGNDRRSGRGGVLAHFEAAAARGSSRGGSLV
jgi:hypothetical protein